VSPKLSGSSEPISREAAQRSVAAGAECYAQGSRARQSRKAADNGRVRMVQPFPNRAKVSEQVRLSSDAAKSVLGPVCRLLARARQGASCSPMDVAAAMSRIVGTPRDGMPNLHQSDQRTRHFGVQRANACTDTAIPFNAFAGPSHTQDTGHALSCLRADSGVGARMVWVTRGRTVNLSIPGRTQARLPNVTT
jgi:hypothetical protein